MEREFDAAHAEEVIRKLRRPLLLDYFVLTAGCVGLAVLAVLARHAAEPPHYPILMLVLLALGVVRPFRAARLVLRADFEMPRTREEYGEALDLIARASNHRPKGERWPVWATVLAIVATTALVLFGIIALGESFFQATYSKLTVPIAVGPMIFVSFRRISRESLMKHERLVARLRHGSPAKPASCAAES